MDLLLLLAGGAAVTAQIAVASAFFALTLAIPLGIGRTSHRRAIRVPCIVYIEFFRGTSLVVQLFWIYYVLPQVGIRLEALTAAILGIALNYSAYGAEVVRGALHAVSREQIQAAHALGLRGWRVLRHVVAPQAMTFFVRPWGNLMIQLLKATSLVSLITIADLTYRAYQMHQLTMRTLPIFGTVLVIYFLMSQCIAFATDRADRHVGRWRFVRPTP